MKGYKELNSNLGIVTGFIFILFSLIWWFSTFIGKEFFFTVFTYQYISPISLLMLSIFVGCVLGFFYKILVDSSKIKRTASYKSIIIDDFRHLDNTDAEIYVVYRIITFFLLPQYLIIRFLIHYPILLSCISVHKLYLFFMEKF